MSDLSSRHRLRHGPRDVIAKIERGEVVDPESYYFRINPLFETAAKRYLAAWGQFQCQCPDSVTEQTWRQAIDDAGRFLDKWGKLADSFGWTPGDLFYVAAHRRHMRLSLVAQGQHGERPGS